MPTPLFTKGNPGKPKGAVAKSTRMVKEVFADAFNKLQKDKKANLLSWAKDNPTEFYKLAAKLIPVQLTGEGGKISVDLSLNDLTNIPTEDILQYLAKKNGGK